MKTSTPQNFEDHLFEFLLDRKKHTPDDTPVHMQAPPFPPLTMVDEDHAYLSGAFSSINQKLHHFVTQVLNAHEYEGSPLYDELLTRDYLAQLVDRVLHLGIRTYNELEEITLEDPETFSRHSFLRATIEAILMVEIFAFRRYRYRHFV